MASEGTHIDISGIPELARLARDVAADGRPRLLRADDTDLAILTPAPTEHHAPPAARPLPEPDAAPDAVIRRRRRHRSVTDLTAGMLHGYAKVPPPSPCEEKDAFEQAVADEVMAGMERTGG